MPYRWSRATCDLRSGTGHGQGERIQTCISAAAGDCTITDVFKDAESGSISGAFGKYKVLSSDQIKLRKLREVSLQDRDDLRDALGVSGSPLDRHVHQQWLANTFD